MQQIPCPEEILKKSYLQFKKDSEKWVSYIQKELNKYGFKIESTEIFDTNDYKVKYGMEIEIFMIDYYIRFSKNGKMIGHHFVLMSDMETHRADEYIEEPYTERGVPPLSRQQKYFYVCPTNKVEKITDRAFENERYSKYMPISKWKDVIKKIVERHHIKVGNKMSLRNKVIRLAKENPELRQHLLPLLKESNQTIDVRKYSKTLEGKILRVIYSETGLDTEHPQFDQVVSQALKNISRQF